MSQKKNVSRVNGAKSKGPITPEGKQRSSRNPLRHSLTAAHTVLLECEDPLEFARMRKQFYDEWNPSTFTEQCILENMIKVQWRLLRIEAIEIAIMDVENARQAPELAKTFAPNPVLLTAVAYTKRADESRSQSILYRYHVRYSREFRAWMNALLQLRNGTPPSPPADSPNDVPTAQEISAATPEGPMRPTIFYFETQVCQTNLTPTARRREAAVLLAQAAGF
jgi:hypothetical protein